MQAAAGSSIRAAAAAAMQQQRRSGRRSAAPSFSRKREPVLGMPGWRIEDCRLGRPGLMA
jgi:hypothetical protein